MRILFKKDKKMVKIPEDCEKTSHKDHGGTKDTKEGRKKGVVVSKLRLIASRQDNRQKPLEYLLVFFSFSVFFV